MNRSLAPVSGSIVAATLLLLLGSQVAQAGIPSTGSGGSARSPWKAAIFGEDFFCDLNDPRSDLQIFANPSNVEPNKPIVFQLSGELACVEVPQGTVNPSLQKGKDIVAPLTGEPTVGRFKLTQISRLNADIVNADTVNLPGNTVTGPRVTPDGFGYERSGNTRTWDFTVNGSGGENLLYVLEALDSNARAFCRLPFGSQSEVDAGNSTKTVCQVVYGLDVSNGAPSPGDYNANGVSGRVVQFSASTSAVGAPELGDLSWGPCHIQAHVKAPQFFVDSVLHASGNGVGDGLDTGIYLQAGEPLIITQVDPVHDLWTSGARPRHSNADGQVRYLFAVGGDDSGFAPGTLIGTNWEDYPLGSQQQWTERGFTAAYGTLVGGIETSPNNITNFFKVGAGFNGVAPAEGTLHLFYWDNPVNDNAGKIAVRVVSGKPVSCAFQGNPAVVEAELFNVDRWYDVTIDPQPTLNVTSKSGDVPTTIRACLNHPGDSSIDTMAASVRVNNVPVPFKLQSVKSSNPGSICNAGQTLEEVKIGIDKRALLDALAIESCSDSERLAFSVVGDMLADGEFFRGEATTRPTNCKKLR